MKFVSLLELSYATFGELLHSRFLVRGSASAPVEIELVEVTAHQSGQAQSGNFALVFTGPLHQFLPQGTYLFEHEKLGACDLFIVPVGKDQKGFRYEAVFNRLIKPNALVKPT